jgi:hypothetical protein
MDSNVSRPGSGRGHRQQSRGGDRFDPADPADHRHRLVGRVRAPALDD